MPPKKNLTKKSLLNKKTLIFFASKIKNHQCKANNSGQYC